MALPLRLRRFLGRLQGGRVEGPPALAALLEPIRWDADALHDVAAILAPLDLGRFARLREQYKDASPDPGYSKYLDIATHVAIQLRHARDLGLTRSGGRPLHVLDIGTGAGYFPYVCRHYGHHAVGLDLGTTPMYDDLVALLGVERVIGRVRPRVPLPAFAVRFDCVTATQMKFNFGPGGAWGQEEWSFLLRDLARAVAHPEAQVYLGFNADRSGVAVSADLAAFFRSRGATVEGGKVHFESQIGRAHV